MGQYLSIRTRICIVASEAGPRAVGVYEAGGIWEIFRDTRGHHLLRVSWRSPKETPVLDETGPFYVLLLVFKFVLFFPY